MRHPSTPTGNNGGRARTRGAIRTHLGRKRVGSRARPLHPETLDRVRAVTDEERHRQEDLFDRLVARVEELFTQAGELTVSAFDRALDTACDGLVTAGEFTAGTAEPLRPFAR